MLAEKSIKNNEIPSRAHTYRIRGIFVRVMKKFLSNIFSSSSSVHTPSLFQREPPFAMQSQSSVNRSKRLILNIMINKPIVTMMKSANPNQPNIIAVVPTPDFTLPLPRSCAIVLAATDAVCCHRTDTSTKTEAMNISASATCETGREGKGLTSRSEPRSSVSSCQPGKVARRRKVMKARIMATILCG